MSRSALMRGNSILAKRAAYDIRLLGLNPGSCTGELWEGQSVSYQYKEDNHSTYVIKLFQILNELLCRVLRRVSGI